MNPGITPITPPLRALRGEGPPRRARGKRRATTLLELLLVLAIIGLITAGAVRAFVAGIDVERRLRESSDEGSRLAATRLELRSLISRAYLSTTPGDPGTYLVGSTADGAGGGLLGAPADELTFTAVGLRMPASALDSTDDFETQNERFGPQGGLVEIALSTIPFDAPDGVTGLFLREQRPADGDPTQGGRQRLLDDNVETIAFEFFDGIDWQSQWDTRTQGAPRLPSAVRVTLTMRERDEPVILIVPLPNSDVTPEDPVAIGGGP